MVEMIASYHTCGKSGEIKCRHISIAAGFTTAVVLSLSLVEFIETVSVQTEQDTIYGFLRKHREPQNDCGSNG